MKKTIITIILINLCFFLFSSNDRIIPKRFSADQLEKIQSQIRESNENFGIRRTHPHQDYFNQRKAEYVPRTSSNNFNKLLVILVEFQEDDNPNTTGNGKFTLEADPDYPMYLASPPYDRVFFETQLEAMKYYYRAVSYDSYQLEYDVYPKKKQAYTLPHELGYYHPLDDNLFIERIEQYFIDAWTTVDNDPDIEDKPSFFGNYGHFMIIHAGPSWQHDTLRNSPQDMPSFFINIADGKEVIVDGGLTKIKTSANVPEKIWQDVDYYSIQDEEGNWIRHYYGYGVVNAVFAHEFGHSLGFADLYNTVNGRPAVGYFDLMDSGGTGIIGYPSHYEGISDVYLVEGLFPALPSPWSRLIAFENDFLDRGILVDLIYENLEQDIKIMASSATRESHEEIIPYFYRLRLSDSEYLLIENRNLNPTGDGGPSIIGALHAIPGQRVTARVALRLAPRDNYDEIYEYDYLLPGFDAWKLINDRDSVHGGGLLIWHIDDNIIEPNFESNNVNARRTRGVRIIEADGLDDIGNPYSRYWRGTAYEYFFKYHPHFDEFGLFIGWSDEIFSDVLSSRTQPMLRTNDGKPSSWKIYDISIPERIMSFRLSNSMFDFTHRVGKFDQIHTISTNGVSPFTVSSIDDRHRTDGETPSIQIITNLNKRYYTQEEISEPWQQTYSDPLINTKPKFDITKLYFEEGQTTYNLLVYDYGFTIINTEDKSKTEYNLFPEIHITSQPLFLKFGENYFVLFTYNDSLPEIFHVEYSADLGITNLVQFGKSIDYTGKFIADDRYLYLLSEHTINVIEIDFENNEHKIITSFSLPEPFNNYEPVVSKQNNQAIVYLMSDTYKIYSFTNTELKPIFDVSRYSDEKPSQLALGYTLENKSGFVLIHTESSVFVITDDGSFYPGFPQHLVNYKLKPDSHPYVFLINNEVYFMMQDDNKGLLGMDIKGNIRHDLSQYWNKGELPPYFFINNSAIYMIYTDFENAVYSAAKTITQNDKILWNGYRNAGIGSVVRYFEFVDPPETDKVEIFVFPNPVRQNNANIRINNTRSTVNVKVYNIAGQLVWYDDYPKTIEDFRNIAIDTTKLSSGMYFVNVEVDGKTYRDKFSIIK